MFYQLLELAKQTLGIIPVVTPVPGAAVVAGVAAEIMRTCEDVSYQKARAKAIGTKSIQLENALDEASRGMEGNPIQEHVDEFRSLLETIRLRSLKWRDRSLVEQWFYRSKMNKEMDRFTEQLDTAIQLFNIRNQGEIIREVQDVQQQGEFHFEQIRDIFLKLADDQADMRKMIQTLLSRTGTQEMTVLLQHGQMALKQMGLETQSTPTKSTAPPSPISTSSNPEAAQIYRKIQHGLAKLLKETGILPPEKCLDGNVELVGNVALSGGSACDVYRGIWLGEKEVALKSMRYISADNETAKRRIVREIGIWSKLSNEHILQFYGYVTDIDMHLYLVSPWLKNGNAVDFNNANPTTDKLNLLRGAAEGLRYLHSQEIVHGNIKCSNILVSDLGEACISDFGMAKMIEEMTTAASTTMARAGSTRWLAPEIVSGGHPSKASDTYSFAMAILEMLSGKHPFYEHKSEVAVIRALITHVVPERPDGLDVQRWLTDDLWALMKRCWFKKPGSRPTMEDIVTFLNK